jgi:hypothetical protein
VVVVVGGKGSSKRNNKTKRGTVSLVKRDQAKTETHREREHETKTITSCFLFFFFLRTQRNERKRAAGHGVQRTAKTVPSPQSLYGERDMY